MEIINKNHELKEDRLYCERQIKKKLSQIFQKFKISKSFAKKLLQMGKLEAIKEQEHLDYLLLTYKKIKKNKAGRCSLRKLLRISGAKANKMIKLNEIKSVNRPMLSNNQLTVKFRCIAYN